jgi:TPR repeat protein
MKVRGGIYYIGVIAMLASTSAVAQVVPPDDNGRRSSSSDSSTYSIIVPPDEDSGRGSHYGDRPSMSLSEARAAFDRGDYQTALRGYYRLAPSGDAEAQFYLGYMLEQGMGGGRDIYSAANWYRKSAEQDYLPAVAYIGYLYSIGRGVSKDLKQAFDWYVKGARMGSADAQNALGTLLRDGVVERNVVVVKKDPNLAIQWFMQAAMQNHARAQNNLATMYRLGQGVKANLPEAVKWYSYAAKNGDPYAMNALGNMYLTGEGVEKNTTLAVKYFAFAANSGLPLAQVSLARLYESGEPDKSKGPSDAALLYAKAAKQGNLEAADRLGFYYANGYGIPRDADEAISWYQAAGDMNYAPSILALAQMFEEGKITQQNKSRALDLYKKCANMGEPVCQRELSRVYMQGDLTSRSLPDAYLWMALAADAFPEGNDKAAAVISRIEISNAMSQDQLNDAYLRVARWKPYVSAPRKIGMVRTPPRKK